MWRCSLAAAKIVGVLDKCITSSLGNCVCQSPVGTWAEALLASRTIYSRNVPWETDTNIRAPYVCPSGRYWHSNSLVKGKCNGSIHWSLSPVTVSSKFLDVCVILAASSSSWNSNISRWVSFTLGLLWWLTWVKNLPAMQETQVRSLGQEDPLEKEMVTHSSILAWEIPWTEEPGRGKSMGLQRVRHNWVTNTFSFLHFKSGWDQLPLRWANGVVSLINYAGALRAIVGLLHSVGLRMRALSVFKIRYFGSLSFRWRS